MATTFNLKLVLDHEVDRAIRETSVLLKKSGYYTALNSNDKPRNYGMKILGEIKGTGINCKYTPNRKVTSTLKTKPKGNLCPLCLGIQSNKMISPISKVRGLIWRNYLIKPNTFPYFKNHFLIISLDHSSENSIRGTQLIINNEINVIKDFIYLSSILTKGTLFFNGLIGNSQMHFHFHYTSEKLPIQDKIRKNKYKELIKKTDNCYIYNFSISKYCVNGVVFIGGKEMYQEVFYFLKEISKKRFLFNLILYKEGSNIYCFVFIRRQVKRKDENDLNMGASSLGGIHLTNAPSCKDSTVFDKYCQETVIVLSKDQLRKLFKKIEKKIISE